MKLPKLPSEAFSLIGPVPVSIMPRECADKEGLYGHFLQRERQIEVAEGMSLDIQWATYWHEVAHAFLIDTGAAHSLTEQQAEVVCDATGTYLTAAIRAGYLAVRKPRAK